MPVTASVDMEAPASRNGEPGAPSTVRLSLDLTPQMKQVLDDVARATGSTRAQVLRRALALMKVVVDAKQQQESPALIDGSGKVTARLIIE